MIITPDDATDNTHLMSDQIWLMLFYNWLDPLSLLQLQIVSQRFKKIAEGALWMQSSLKAQDTVKILVAKESLMPFYEKDIQKKLVLGDAPDFSLLKVMQGLMNLYALNHQFIKRKLKTSIHMRHSINRIGSFKEAEAELAYINLLLIIPFLKNKALMLLAEGFIKKLHVCALTEAEKIISLLKLVIVPRLEIIKKALFIDEIINAIMANNNLNEYFYTSFVNSVAINDEAVADKIYKIIDGSDNSYQILKLLNILQSNFIDVMDVEEFINLISRLLLVKNISLGNSLDVIIKIYNTCLPKINNKEDIVQPYLDEIHKSNMLPSYITPFLSGLNIYYTYNNISFAIEKIGDSKGKNENMLNLLLALINKIDQQSILALVNVGFKILKNLPTQENEINSSIITVCRIFAGCCIKLNSEESIKIVEFAIFQLKNEDILIQKEANYLFGQCIPQLSEAHIIKLALEPAKEFISNNPQDYTQKVCFIKCLVNLTPSFIYNEIYKPAITLFRSSDNADEMLNAFIQINLCIVKLDSNLDMSDLLDELLIIFNNPIDNNIVKLALDTFKQILENFKITDTALCSNTLEAIYMLINKQADLPVDTQLAALKILANNQCHAVDIIDDFLLIELIWSKLKEEEGDFASLDTDFRKLINYVFNNNIKLFDKVIDFLVCDQPIRLINAPVVIDIIKSRVPYLQNESVEKLYNFLLSKLNENTPDEKYYYTKLLAIILAEGQVKSLTKLTEYIETLVNDIETINDAFIYKLLKIVQPYLNNELLIDAFSKQNLNGDLVLSKSLKEINHCLTSPVNPPEIVNFFILFLKKISRFGRFDFHIDNIQTTAVNCLSTMTEEDLLKYNILDVIMNWLSMNEKKLLKIDFILLMLDKYLKKMSGKIDKTAMDEKVINPLITILSEPTLSQASELSLINFITRIVLSNQCNLKNLKDKIIDSKMKNPYLLLELTVLIWTMGKIDKEASIKNNQEVTFFKMDSNVNSVNANQEIVRFDKTVG